MLLPYTLYRLKRRRCRVTVLSVVPQVLASPAGRGGWYVAPECETQIDLIVGSLSGYWPPSLARWLLTLTLSN